MFILLRLVLLLFLKNNILSETTTDSTDNNQENKMFINCSIFVNQIFRPSADNINIQLRTACEDFHYLLSNGKNLIDNSNFDRKKNVVIYFPGWGINPNNATSVSVLGKAYFCRDHVNFLVLDAYNYINKGYPESAYNSRDIGILLSSFLIDLLEIVPIENIHLIGHSLGAQIMSFAAQDFFKTTEIKIKRITGLDPARPCFNENVKIFNSTGLSAEDAEFVDVIHTNTGQFGKRAAVGNVDFFVNGLSSSVPGCSDIQCSHKHSWRYYAESVYPGNEQNFMAIHCSSFKDLEEENCSGKTYPMGYAAFGDLLGNYFVEVRNSSPFGLNGDEKREKQNANCGLCKTHTVNTDKEK